MKKFQFVRRAYPSVPILNERIPFSCGKQPHAKTLEAQRQAAAFPLRLERLGVRLRSHNLAA
jgi:hypothetical protein